MAALVCACGSADRVDSAQVTEMGERDSGIAMGEPEPVASEPEALRDAGEPEPMSPPRDDAGNEPEEPAAPVDAEAPLPVDEPEPSEPVAEPAPEPVDAGVAAPDEPEPEPEEEPAAEPQPEPVMVAECPSDTFPESPASGDMWTWIGSPCAPDRGGTIAGASSFGEPLFQNADVASFRLPFTDPGQQMGWQWEILGPHDLTGASLVVRARWVDGRADVGYPIEIDLFAFSDDFSGYRGSRFEFHDEQFGEWERFELPLLVDEYFEPATSNALSISVISSVGTPVTVEFDYIAIYWP